MQRKPLFNAAASTLIIASSMVGCSGAALNTHAGVAPGKMEQMASAQARDAEQAIARRDAAKAIMISEAAVAAEPNNADYRTLLGRAYLMDGRFDSARTAFEDALTLGGTDSRAIVNLALIHVAQGHNGRAQDVLSTHVGTLSAADYGLAMAMAGDPEEAVRILSQAIHDPSASAKERQNLAYSYALAGKWVEARQVASLDLPPLEAAKRVAGWAQLAQPGADSQRVIAMMGVSPRGDDAGLPVRLALAPAGSAPVQMAAAAPAINAPIVEGDAIMPAEIEPVADAPVEMAQAEAPVVTPVSVPASAPAAAPALQFEQPAKGAPLSPMLRPTPSPLIKAETPKVRPAAIWNPVDQSRGSSWVVQLGAFSTPQAAKAAWGKFVGRNDKLEQFPLVQTEATVDGRQFHRVAIAGFGDRAGALRLCEHIRANGGVCFVRMGGPEAAPSQWALAKQPRLLAMR